MKILHIITGLRIGGAEQALFNFLEAMGPNNTYHHSVVCFYNGPIAEKIRNLGINVTVVRGFVRGYDPIGLFHLYKIIKNYKPVVIHTALWAANMAGRLMGFCCKIPVINELHGNFLHEGRLRNWFEKLSWRGARYIVAVSDSVRAVYEDHHFTSMKPTEQAALNRRLVTIDNGINREALVVRAFAQEPVPRSVWGLAQDDFVIGAIGRLEKIKSFDVLIRSTRFFIDMLPEVEKSRIKICLVGDGAEREYLQNLVKELSLEAHVIFVGWRLDASRFYALFDCFALSSQSEGLSIALLGAVSLGIPVVSTHSAKIHDALVDGVNGFLVPANDCGDYAHALNRLYNREIPKSLNHQPLMPFPFDIKKTVAAYVGLYEDLVLR